MMTAMLAIPLVDGLAKHASVNYSPQFVQSRADAIAAMLVLPFAVNGSRLLPQRRLGAQLWARCCG
jgi:hypothetical protein